MHDTTLFPRGHTMKLWQDQIVVDALKSILEAYPYLEYDEAETKRPSIYNKDMLKIKIKDSRKISASVGNKIASDLSKATGRKFIGTTPETRKYIYIGEISKKQYSRDSEIDPTQKGAQ